MTLLVAIVLAKLTLLVFLGHARGEDHVVFRNPTLLLQGRVGSRLVLVYESRAGIKLTTSDNGVDWGKNTLLLAASRGNLDRFGHVTPSLLVPPESGTAVLHFGAASATTRDRFGRS